MHYFRGYFGTTRKKPELSTVILLPDKKVFTIDLSPESISAESSSGFIISTHSISYKEQSSNSAMEALLEDLIAENGLTSNIFKDISGYFSIVYLNKTDSTIYFATDKMGTHPLYYSTNSDDLFFSNSLKSILDMKPSLNQISHQSIYQYVYFHCIPAPDTIYKEVQKLKPAECLSIGENRQSITYFIPEFETSQLAEEDLQEQLLTALESSVNRSVQGSDLSKVGAFLSGGLDSSTVAGFLAKKAGPGKAKTFTIGFNAQGYDESAYAKITADHFQTDHHVYYVTPEDVAGALEDISAYYDEPFGNSSALPAYYCAKFAKENCIETLLAGDGGDELFAGNERYAKQKIFESYFKIPSSVRKLFLELPLSFIPENSNIPLLSKAASYVRQAKIRLPERLQTYNFLHRFDPKEVFKDDFIVQIDLSRPLQLQQERYAGPPSGDAVQRMLYFDWKFTLADNDLVKVNNMCHLTGVNVLYPMLDDELLALATIVPSETMLPGNDLRKFYKDATRNFLSEKTLNKSKKGFGLPFGVWIRENKQLQELAYSNVRELKSKGYFKDEFLENAIAKHGSDTPGYYGELIWILMMLNLWLKAH